MCEIRMNKTGKTPITLDNAWKISAGFWKVGNYEYDQHHVLISGKIEIRQEDIVTGNQDSTVFTAPCIVHIPKNTPHLFTAIVDSIVLEIFDDEYSNAAHLEHRPVEEEITV